MSLWRVSASQVREYLLCPRKWYECYVLKNKPPENESFKNGIEVHGEIEHYEKTGQIRESKWSGVVKEVVPFLPIAPLNSKHCIEQWFELPTWDGGPLFVGKIDLIKLEEQEVVDFKTCKDFKHMKKPEDLQDDVQMVAYAKYMLTQFASSADHVKVSHYNIKIKSTPQVISQGIEVNREHIENRWNTILDTIREMVAWSEKAPVLSMDLPANKNACSMYGGCFYRSKCTDLDSNPFQESSLTKLEGGAPMSTQDDLVERMMARARAAREETDFAQNDYVRDDPTGEKFDRFLDKLEQKSDTPPPVDEFDRAPFTENNHVAPDDLRRGNEVYKALREGRQVPGWVTPPSEIYTFKDPTPIVPPDAPSRETLSSEVIEKPKRGRKTKAAVVAPTANIAKLKEVIERTFADICELRDLIKRQ